VCGPEAVETLQDKVNVFKPSDRVPRPALATLYKFVPYRRILALCRIDFAAWLHWLHYHRCHCMPDI